MPDKEDARPIDKVALPHQGRPQRKAMQPFETPVSHPLGRALCLPRQEFERSPAADCNAGACARSRSLLRYHFLLRRSDSDKDERRGILADERDALRTGVGIAVKSLRRIEPAQVGQSEAPAELVGHTLCATDHDDSLIWLDVIPE